MNFFYPTTASVLQLTIFLSVIILCTTETEKIPFSPPVLPENANNYFFETFTDVTKFNQRWVYSATKNADGSKKYTGLFKLGELHIQGNWPGDNHLLVQGKAQHYGMAAKMIKPVYFEDQDILLVQYEVTLQEGLECGGAYIKLLTLDDTFKLDDFNDKTPYTIMFGPDKCGTSSKIHFIIRYQNPTTKEYEEKHSTHQLSDTFYFTDKKTHIYQLIIHSNGKYSIAVDLGDVAGGNLLTDLSPSIIPPKEIDDPEDKKPDEWDDREQIIDHLATKPEDWDEDALQMIVDKDAVKPDNWNEEAAETIPDPDEQKPDGWDDDEDGEWEPPMIHNPACDQYGCGQWNPPAIRNPDYKGKWTPPLMANPDYRGVWEAKKIENPGYFEEVRPFNALSPIGAIGIELWTMSDGIAFDNIVITDSLQTGNYIVKDSWMIKNDLQVSALGEKSIGNLPDYIMEITNQYPFLWGIYAAVVVLPFIICCWCLPTKPRQIPKPVTGAEGQTEPKEKSSPKASPQHESPPPFDTDKELTEQNMATSPDNDDGNDDHVGGNDAGDNNDADDADKPADSEVSLEPRGDSTDMPLESDDADDSAVSPPRRRKPRRDN